jgi:hypothetical protein
MLIWALLLENHISVQLSAFADAIPQTSLLEFRLVGCLIPVVTNQSIAIDFSISKAFLVNRQTFL